MNHLGQDLRYVLRALSRQPAFTLMVLITLGVGIGATTAIFSVAEAVLFRPLPYKDPDRLVFIWNRLTKSGVEKSPVAAPDLVDYQEQTELFASIVGMAGRDHGLTGDGQKPAPIVLAETSPELFSIVGVELLLGKMFGPEDESKRAPSTVRRAEDSPPAPLIVSYEFWQRRYGGDPKILGRSVEIDGQPFFIQGVAPKGFRLLMPLGTTMPTKVDAWAPFDFNMRLGGRSTQWVTTLGRLKPGVTLAAAQGEMDKIVAHQRELFEFHRNVGMEIRVVPYYDELTQGVRPFLLALLGAAALLLLLTFSNVTNLLLLRAAARQKEISIRAAVGGGPARLLAHALVESTLLALVGGAVGIVLAHWGTRLFVAMQADHLPRVDETRLDAKVLSASLGLALLAALVSGLAVAWRTSRHDQSALLAGRGSSLAPARQRLRKVLVVTEISLSLLLLIGTGLVYRTSRNVSRIDPGYHTEGVLTAKLSVPIYKYSTSQRRADFLRQVHQRLATLPGVRHAGAVEPLPLTQEIAYWYGPWSVEGMNPETWTENEADYREALPGYFASMDIRVLKGRTLDEDDNRVDARLVAVVDDVFAQRAWPNEEAVGKRLMLGRFDDTGGNLVPAWVDVVGVVEHVRDLDLTHDGRGSVYFPLPFWNFEIVYLTLQSATSDPLSLIGPLEDMVDSLDPDVALTAVRPLEEYLDQALAPVRFALATIALFAAIAVILATIGLYGVIATAVRQGRREIGIRMAFGAPPAQIRWLVLRQSLSLAAIGVPLGLLAAFLLTGKLSSLLNGVTPTDPLTFTVIVALQIVIAVLASLVPTWRATTVDPVQVLRSE